VKKKIVILGSTGSIGQQSLEVIKQHLNEFEVVGLSGWEDTKLLQEQINIYKPKVAVVKNEAIARNLKKNLNKQNNIKILWGTNGLINIATLEEADIIGEKNCFVQQRSNGSRWRIISEGSNI